MKWFVDAHTFDGEFQGTRTFLHGIYNQLVLLRPDVEFYFAASNVKTLEEAFGVRPNLHYLKYKSGSSTIRIFFEIPQLLKRYKIDIAHFQYVSPWRKHCRYIVTTHDILFNDYKEEFSFLFRIARNFLFRRSIQMADVKTTVSDYSAGRIAFHYRLNKNELIVVPNGVGPRFFEPFNKSGSRDYLMQNYNLGDFILYVSRIEPRKNNATLLKAFLKALPALNGASLVFIGKKSIYSQELEHVIKTMSKDQKQHFRHYEQVSQTDLLKFYQAAKLFVYPSKAEGFGIPPLEAAALQIPVLCANCTAMQDFTFFSHLLFDPENENELMEKIIQVYHGDLHNDYQQISNEIKDKFNWRNSALRLLEQTG